MKWGTRFAYGCGQMLKDLVASVISAFVIVYFENCLGIRPAHIGSLLLFGQIINSVSTPLVGFLSDRAVAYTSCTVEEENSKSSHLLATKVKGLLKHHFGPHRRKSWHLWGCILMGLSFPTLFSLPESFENLPTWSKLATVGSLLVTIQIGWAAVQIAHLTLLNYLTNDANERVLLVSLRYCFSSIGDISTFTLSYLILQQGIGNPDPASFSQASENLLPTTQLNDSLSAALANVSLGNLTEISNPAVNNKITPKDMVLFRNITLVLTAIGALTVVIFQCLVPETKCIVQENDSNEDRKQQEDIFDITKSHPQFIKSLDELHSISSQLHRVGQSRTINSCGTLNDVLPEVLTQTVSMKYYTWFCIPRFWLCCAIFTSLRVASTLALMYLSPFLLEDLQLEKSSIMLFPLISYCANFLTTALQHLTTKLLGRMVNALLGILFFLAYCATLHFCKVGDNGLIILAAVLSGVGHAFNNVTAIMVISDLIGSSQVQTAAFVHGFASLTDKIATGLSLQFIQLALPTLTYRHVQVFIVGGLLTVGASLFIFDRIRYRNWSLSTITTTKGSNRTSLTVNALHTPPFMVDEKDGAAHVTPLLNGESVVGKHISDRMAG